RMARVELSDHARPHVVSHKPPARFRVPLAQFEHLCGGIEKQRKRRVRLVGVKFGRSLVAKPATGDSALCLSCAHSVNLVQLLSVRASDGHTRGHSSHLSCAASAPNTK